MAIKKISIIVNDQNGTMSESSINNLARTAINNKRAKDKANNYIGEVLNTRTREQYFVIDDDLKTRLKENSNILKADNLKRSDIASLSSELSVLTNKLTTLQEEINTIKSNSSEAISISPNGVESISEDRVRELIQEQITSSLETELAEVKASNATLSSKVAQLTTIMNELLQSSAQGTIEAYSSWRIAVTSEWSNVFGGSSAASGNSIQFNNQKSAFLAPENVTGIKFKLRAPNNPGQYILWLICSVNRSEQSNVRALTVDFETRTNATYTSWIKSKEGHTSYNGLHGASVGNIKDVFNVHNVEITVLIEDGKIKCSNALGFRFEVNAFAGSGFVTRLGIGSQANFSNNIEAYDIKVLTT